MKTFAALRHVDHRLTWVVLFLLFLLGHPLLPEQAVFAGTIVREETVTTNSTTSPASLPLIQGGTDQTYVLYVATRSNQDVTSVTGGGLTWTEQKEQCAGRAQTGIRLWTAQGSPPSAFQAQIDWEGTKFLSAVLTRYSGAGPFEDPTGENTNGENGACSDGPDNTASQLTLTSTLSGSVHSIGLAPRNRNIDTFTSGYVEVGNDVSGTGGDMTKLIVYEQEFGTPTTDTFEATLSSSQDWATAGIVLTPSVPLPVELVSFEAQVDGQDVALRWHTASETNNAGFLVEIEEATTASFKPLAFVEGQGTTNVPHSYSYRAARLHAGRYRFRLKQIDYDGAYEYSPELEVAVAVPKAFQLAPAYPNPFNPETRFSLSVARQQYVTVGVYDLLGRRVAMLYAGVWLPGLTRAFRFDAGTLPGGLYLIRAEGENFTVSRAVTLLK